MLFLFLDHLLNYPLLLPLQLTLILQYLLLGLIILSLCLRQSPDGAAVDWSLVDEHVGILFDDVQTSNHAF